MPYDYENSTEGLELARAELENPLPVTQENLDKGKELYEIFCAVCHGDTGDGQGILAQREKFLGIPSYADPGRNVTEGSVYHVQMFGLNSMGSYASQTNELERWQITQSCDEPESSAERGAIDDTPVEAVADSTAVEVETLGTEEVHEETLQKKLTIRQKRIA